VDVSPNGGGTVQGIIGEEIAISGLASGGTPPYTYAWDLDNDGEYDDAVGKDITHSWSIADTYTIGLQVTDCALATATGTYTVVVSEWDPWTYDADEDDAMEIKEVLTAITDYFAGEITLTKVLQVIRLYFGGQYVRD